MTVLLPQCAKVALDLDTGSYDIIGIERGWGAADALPVPSEYDGRCLFTTRLAHVEEDARITFEMGYFEAGLPPVTHAGDQPCRVPLPSFA